MFTRDQIADLYGVPRRFLEGLGPGSAEGDDMASNPKVHVKLEGAEALMQYAELIEQGRMRWCRGTREGEVRVLAYKEHPGGVTLRDAGAGDERLRVDIVASDATLDSYGDVIEPGGWELDRYKANPVLIVDHWPSVQRIAGSGENVRVEKSQLLLEGVLDDGTNDTANMVASRLRNGSLRTVSVGFRPLEFERIRDEEGDWTGGYRFLRQELLEVSFVAIPANPSAVVGPPKAAAVDDRVPAVADLNEEQLRQLESVALNLDLCRLRGRF